MDGLHTHFGWYELLTTDMAAASTFYASVLGWRTYDASTPQFSYGIFSAGEAPVCGLMGLPPEGQKEGATPRWVGYVAVDDIHGTVDRLRHLGGVVLVPPTDTNIGRISIVADPQGATLAIAQGLKQGEPRLELDNVGHVGWHELFAVDWTTAFAFYSELFGWQRAETDAGSLKSYQLLSAGGRRFGGMFTKPPMAPLPFWLYYFNVPDVAIAARRVTDGGGRILQGPTQLPDNMGWIVRCTDPQGAMFALQGATNQSGIEQLSTAELAWSAEWGGFTSRGKVSVKPGGKKPSLKPKP
jgi:predicted enzyme related to lactoylglutathione lyase